MKKTNSKTIKLIKAIRAYWKDDASLVFRTARDALFGFAVLVVLPFLSVIALVATGAFVYPNDANGAAFWPYSFPLMSIGAAGMLDSFARIEYKPRINANAKLVVRITINDVAVAMAGVAGGQNNCYLRLIPALLLVGNGCLLLGEMGKTIYEYCAVNSPYCGN